MFAAKIFFFTLLGVNTIYYDSKTIVGFKPKGLLKPQIPKEGWGSTNLADQDSKPTEKKISDKNCEP